MSQQPGRGPKKFPRRGPCSHSCWRCDDCGQVLDLEEPLDCENPLVLGLGMYPDNRMSQRIEAFTHSRLVGLHILHDALRPALEEYARCGRVLVRIGKPR